MAVRIMSYVSKSEVCLGPTSKKTSDCIYIDNWCGGGGGAKIERIGWEAKIERI